MAVAYTWPATLPQYVDASFSETGGVNIVRTPTDMGPAKQRRLSKRVQTMNVTFNMTTAQVEILRGFVEDTLKGTARFGFNHPRTNSQVEARIQPGNGGEMYQISYLVPSFWRVSMILEILP